MCVACVRVSFVCTALKVEPRPSTAKQRLVFRITDESSNLSVDVAAETEIEMTKWMERIKEAVRLYQDLR